MSLGESRNHGSEWDCLEITCNKVDATMVGAIPAEKERRRLRMSGKEEEKHPEDFSCRKSRRWVAL